MDLIYMKDSIKRSIKILIIFVYVISLEFADGRKLGQRQSLETTKHKGTVKTIESENGEVIDCVDVYKQPAFDHPLLQNHTIQIWPSKSQDVDEKMILLQEWNKNGEHCPERSIPILRSPKLNYPRKVPFDTFIKDLDNDENPRAGHEYATAQFSGKNYGGSSIINVWNPSTSIGEISIAQIWVTAGTDNSVEAGWIVDNPYDLYPKEPRTFIYWTRDLYKYTGCFNLECPGFVQVSSKIALGSAIRPVSTYDGDQYEIQLSVTKERNNGDWWVEIQGERVGYWPRAIFTFLADVADRVQWGGEIYNSKAESRHISTKMGSGHFPSEGYKKASYFKKLQFRDVDDNTFKDVPGITPVYISKPSCYDIKAGRNSESGSFFFYGGPGYSDMCKE